MTATREIAGYGLKERDEVWEDCPDPLGHQLIQQGFAVRISTGLDETRPREGPAMPIEDTPTETED